jgi:hypothetical protein
MTPLSAFAPELLERKKQAARDFCGSPGRLVEKIPAITDFRAVALS